MVAGRGKVLALAAALSLLVFIVLPGSLYLGNLHAFMAPPGPIARLLLLPASLFMAIVWLSLKLSRRNDFSMLCSTLAALTLLCWIQSYVLVGHYGLLDGSPIDWSTPAWRAWVDLPIWALGLVAAAVFHRRVGQGLTTAAFVIVAAQAAVLVLDGVSHRDALKLKATQDSIANELEPMARFSSGRNVLHIVLDSFQADVFNDIMDGPAARNWRSALSGFTFFEENLGTFPATHLALPAIVSGKVFRNHMPRPEFMEVAFGGESILNAAHDAGFEVDIASDPMMLGLLMKGRFDNAYLTDRPSLVENAARIFDLALFRLAPHWLKPLVYQEQRWLIRRWAARSDLMKFPYFTHNAFLADITRRFAVDRAAPVFKFFHLMTTHAPFVVNQDCAYAGRVLPRVRETVTWQSACSLAFVVPLLERMKEAGIYDSSLIVIMADHGGHIPPHRYRPGHFVQGDKTYELPPELLGLATPLLAIKPPGTVRPFTTSSALTSTTDLAATIDDLLGLDADLPGLSLFDGNRSPVAERRFFGQHWSRDDFQSDYIQNIEEFRVSGSAYQIESWRFEAAHLPPGRR